MLKQTTKVVVQPSGHMLAEATRMSTDSFLKYQESNGHYNNTQHSHLIGKLGELAVECWFQDKCESSDPLEVLEWQWANIDSAFRFPHREHDYDISYQGTRYEVKTWSLVHWEKWGRCVAKNQMPALLRKADRIIWCTYDHEKNLVELHGWNQPATLSSIPTKDTGPANGRKVTNHQVPLRMIYGMERL